jgi:hypothetical protein
MEVNECTECGKLSYLFSDEKCGVCSDTETNWSRDDCPLPERVQKRILRKKSRSIAPVDIPIEELDYTPASYEYNEELAYDKPLLLKTPHLVPMNVSKPVGETGVVEDGKVVFDNDDVGMTLEFSDESPPEGTRVELGTKNDYYVAYTEAQQKKQDEIDENLRRLRDAVKVFANELLVLRAKAFWKQYDLQFDYKLAINLRTSGLKRGSTGTGRAKDTVNHLYLCEEVEDGRLKREDGRFLCKGESKMTDTVTDVNYTPNDGENYPRKVTCSRCLELMERWEKEGQKKLTQF